MSNALIETKDNISTPANEAENIIAAAREDGSFEKLLKFKKGKYFVGEGSLPSAPNLSATRRHG